MIQSNLQRTVCNVAKRSQIPFLQRLAWNKEFREGYWQDKLRGCEVTLELIIANALQGSLIVDLGCGTGVMATHLFARGWTGKYLGIDLSDVAIESARRTCPAAEWRVSNISDPIGLLPDMLLLIESIYYLPVAVARALIEQSGARFILCRVCDRRRYIAYVDMLLCLGFHEVSTREFAAVLYR